MASLLPESLEARLVGPHTVHGGRNYGQRTEGRGGQSLSVHRGSVHTSPRRSLVRDVFCCLRVRVTIRGKTVTQRARGGLRTPQLPVTGRMSLPRARVGWRTVCTGGSVKRWPPIVRCMNNVKVQEKLLPKNPTLKEMIAIVEGMANSSVLVSGMHDEKEKDNMLVDDSVNEV
ncbi:hypothetical protein NDU88_003015 [Pleurodeles waltl]|uniref:Uncharacterized protein n=1 Tax=Pleurodeles waltl TaxID=8319 RepID=A0AAV7WR65_PLEWA|nr:hypothetical protein NDU88_003015 [Pleurodeles waltl]